MEALKYPKHPRVRDPKLLSAYHAREPRCQVLSCRKRAAPQPHHVHPNGLGGPGDVESNLISLCVLHHVGPLGPHTLGHRAWFRRFQFDLTPETAEKVVAALAPLKGD